MRFCKDCKHMDEAMRCNAPQNTVVYVNEALRLVTGNEQPQQLVKRGANCAALRQDRGPEMNATVCGPDGNWFEAKA